MRIDHIIVGTDDILSSIHFYTELLSFCEYENFIDTGTGKEGKILIRNSLDSNLKILLVPFEKFRLPNPQHIAFIVEKKQFESIYKKVSSKKIKIRAEPHLSSKKEGIGTLIDHKKKYQNFYFLDPSGVNLEILREIDLNEMD